jgi:beta-galactosidase
MPQWLPRVGLQLGLREDLQQMTWFGRGPFETYPDRKTGAKVGVYSGPVADQYVPYLVPGDYGNKTDVRWVALTDGEQGLLATGGGLLNVSAQLYDTDHVSRALYPPQLERSGPVTLNLDHAVTGVGETPNKTHPRYRVLPGSFHYVVHLQPLRPGDTPAEIARQLLARME